MFEIGNSLREARLRQHLDFSAAEQATKIRGKYLRALEDEQFELLPAETYVRGFLRTYAECLGLDGQLYVDEYNSRFVVGDDEAALVTGRPRRSQARPRPQRRFAAGAVAATLAGIAAVAALVIVAWKFGGGESASPTYPGLGSTNSETRTRAQTQQPLQTNRVQLVVTAAGGSCWVLVRRGSAGGKELYRGTLDAGQTQRFDGTRLWVSADQPQNLQVRLNGRNAALAGAKPGIFVVTPTGLRRATTSA